MATSFLSALQLAVLPVCTSLAFRVAALRLIAYRQAECPLARGTTYYFAQSGNDTTGNGSSGNPWKTLSKANAIIAASSGNIACLFNRGDTWLESQTISIGKNNVTLGAYGTARLAKPLFSLFSLQYAANNASWQTSTNRADAYTATYSRSETTTVGWFREAGDVTNIYIRCASIAQVDAQPGSWYWASNVLYVHPRGNTSPKTDGRPYEAVPSNSTPGITTWGEGVRIDSIRQDGWSAHISNGHTGQWPIMQTGGTLVVTNCECYFSADHCYGMTATSGGVGTFIGNRVGWCTPGGSGGSVAIVGYALNGGQEFIAYNNTSIGGDCPTSSVKDGNGQLVFGHTGDGTSKFALALAWGNVSEPGPYQCNKPTTFTSGDCPAWSDLINCRTFVVDEVYRTRAPLSGSGKVLGVLDDQGANSAAVVYLNSRIGMSIEQAGGGSMSFQSPFGGTFINVDFNIDLTGYIPATTSDEGGLVNYAATFKPQVYYSRLAVRFGDGRFRWGLVRPLLHGAATLTAKFHASLLDMIGAADAYVALTNSTTVLNGNYYSGFASSASAAYGGGTSGGYDADTARIEGTGLLTSVNPAAGSPLILTGAAPTVMGYRLEHDIDWQPRNVLTSTGPRDVDLTSDAATLDVDTQSALASLATLVTNLATANTNITAIKVKTDVPAVIASQADAQAVPAATKTAMEAAGSKLTLVDNRLPSTPAAAGDAMALVTGAITSSKFASNSITAGAIAAGAFDGKGEWAVNATVASSFDAVMASIAAVAAAVESQLVDEFAAVTPAGDGDVLVDHNTGGTDELRVKVGSAGVPNATIVAYVASDYAAGTLPANPPRTTTRDDGRWQWPLMLDAGVSYTLLVLAPGYEPYTKALTL